MRLAWYWLRLIILKILWRRRSIHSRERSWYYHDVRWWRTAVRRHAASVAHLAERSPGESNEVTPGENRKDARALPLVSLHQTAVRLIKAICCRCLFTSSDFSFISFSGCGRFILSVNPPAPRTPSDNESPVIFRVYFISGILSKTRAFWDARLIFNLSVVAWKTLLCAAGSKPAPAQLRHRQTLWILSVWVLKRFNWLHCNHSSLILSVRSAIPAWFNWSEKTDVFTLVHSLAHKNNHGNDAINYRQFQDHVVHINDKR